MGVAARDEREGLVRSAGRTRRVLQPARVAAGRSAPTRCRPCRRGRARRGRAPRSGTRPRSAGSTVTPGLLRALAQLRGGSGRPARPAGVVEDQRRLGELLDRDRLLDALGVGGEVEQLLARARRARRGPRPRPAGRSGRPRARRRGRRRRPRREFWPTTRIRTPGCLDAEVLRQRRRSGSGGRCRRTCRTRRSRRSARAPRGPTRMRLLGLGQRALGVRAAAAGRPRSARARGRRGRTAGRRARPPAGAPARTGSAGPSAAIARPPRTTRGAPRRGNT